MPADHLTEAAPAQLSAAVLAVLAGQDEETASADHGVPTAELSEAVQTYLAAGYAALEQRSQQRWSQVFIEFPAWEQAEAVAATELPACLHRLQIDGWWFLRKHPCWRLRLRFTILEREPRVTALQIAETFNGLASAGAITGWRHGIYEPEYAAFGGSAAMEIAHELFCADSRGVLQYARIPPAGIGRRELSVMLLHTLLRSAELDWFERGDVFHRVAQLRPTSLDPAPSAALDRLTDDLRKLAYASTDHSVFDPCGPARFVGAWQDAFHTAGRRLAAASRDGRLDRGLRAVLAHVVIFHWNRLGLPATTQSVLARAATAAFLPRT
ncbi:thiopeptide-type bacteriocin biosynthesis protein [Actinomadura nitritigenes]|uniref:thiopeptide-type bacteriocin biosynthesis protein n=1 Tax=Actinomadura nitritigenes TaxID=134602 RepID=UPI0036C0304C